MFETWLDLLLRWSESRVKKQHLKKKLSTAVGHSVAICVRLCHYLAQPYCTSCNSYEHETSTQADRNTTNRKSNSMCLIYSECVSISKTTIYLYKSTKAQWGVFKSDNRFLKSKITIQNGCQKTHKRNSKQSVIIKKAQQNSKWLTKKP